MNSLFIHNSWFRLLGPLFSGFLVYLLILVVNDAVLYIQEDFLSQELLVCIVLAYITQEFSRFLLKLFERVKWTDRFVLPMVFQLLGSMCLTIGLVSLMVFLYFTNILLYEPSVREIMVFNSMYAFITALYVVLYWAHFFLFQRNTKKLEKETKAKEAIERDFSSYVMDIHSNLLFESLEAMLVKMKSDPAKAEQMADHFSTVYRYILSKRKNEIVSLKEELSIVHHFIKLCNQLPRRKLKLGEVMHQNGFIVPTVLIKILEHILRTTIPSNNAPLTIDVIETDDTLSLVYQAEEKLRESLSLQTLNVISQRYRFYSNHSLHISTNGSIKTIQLPKLNFHESSDH